MADTDCLSAKQRKHTNRRGFTLVELMVVMVILGILGGLVLTGVFPIAQNAPRTRVKMEITQLQTALMGHKNKYGEFPPDFANVAHGNATVRADAQDAVIRHLRKMFPRYTPVGDKATPANTPTPWSRYCYDVNSNYPGVNPANFDAACGLAFWLGGLPEESAPTQWKPAGFHSDPTFPFRTGTPRTEALYDFSTERLQRTASGQFRYFARADDQRPLVYFRAMRLTGARGANEYAYVDPTTTTNVLPLSFPIFDSANATADYAVPYLAPPVSTTCNVGANERVWRNPDNFQIIWCGMDGAFGEGANFRYSQIGQEVARAGSTQPGMSEGNFDNVANFSDVTIEDELKR